MPFLKETAEEENTNSRNEQDRTAENKNIAQPHEAAAQYIKERRDLFIAILFQLYPDCIYRPQQSIFKSVTHL